MIHTTYFGGLGNVARPADEDPVYGVVRHPQDFVGRVVSRNIPAVAPPEDLLSAFKAVEDAAERDGQPNPSAVAWNSVSYQMRYHQHLEQNTGARIVVKELRTRALEGDIWLVCWEKDCRWCHRRLLADHIATDTDLDVRHHPDPATIDVSDESSGDESGQDTATLTEFGGETA